MQGASPPDGAGGHDAGKIGLGCGERNTTAYSASTAITNTMKTMNCQRGCSLFIRSAPLPLPQPVLARELATRGSSIHSGWASGPHSSCSSVDSMLNRDNIIHGAVLVLLVVIVVLALVWLSNDTRVFQTLGGNGLQETVK